SPLCPLARGLCLPSLRLRRRRETIGGLLPGERVRVCAAAAREDVGVRRGGDRGHGVERGAGGVHVPVPLRRPLPDHARRPPPRGGDRALPLLLALPHRRLQRGGLRRRQGAPAEAAGRRAARRRRLSGAHRTPRGWLVGMDGRWDQNHSLERKRENHCIRGSICTCTCRMRKIAASYQLLVVELNLSVCTHSVVTKAIFCYPSFCNPGDSPISLLRLVEL
uniref:Uncharacterized protein n=1 Tax=Triticum urartu TaxID=4572 RepID=A0A8R7V9C0_TRIUA